MSQTSRVSTEDELESIVEVGLEMLDGKVAPEVTVGGLNGGNTWDFSAPTNMKNESVEELLGHYVQ